MKVGIVNFSDLGDRMDAGFHLSRVKHAETAALIESRISKEQALEVLNNLPTEVLALISPLERTARSKHKTDRTQLLRAADEYPFLALAIIKEEGQEVIARVKQEALAAARKIAGIADQIAALEPEPNLPDGTRELDALLTAAIKDNHFVQGVVYFDGDVYSIPVETSKTAYVADCWVIPEEEFSATRIAELVDQGDVPMPVRHVNLGKAVGYIEALPCCKKNYGMGWRRPG